MANGTTGYQGFRGFSLRPPPMLKPGETLESNRSKYLNPGNYPTPSACLLGMRDKTISVMMSQGLTLSDYHVPDPLGISAAFSNKPATKPCAGMTMSRHSYGRSSSDHAACPTFHQPKWSSSVACDLIVEDQTKSSYQMDMGMAGECPSGRPFVAKTGMASTTMDLCDGSAKTTYHVPGYSGHIPCSSRNTQRLTMLMVKWLGQKLQISSSTINTICPDIPVSIHPSRKMTRDLVFQAQAHRLHLVR